MILGVAWTDKTGAISLRAETEDFSLLTIIAILNMKDTRP